jgi:hypothetical protein
MSQPPERPHGAMNPPGEYAGKYSAAGGVLYHWLSEEPSAQVTGTTTTGKGT